MFNIEKSRFTLLFTALNPSAPAIAPVYAVSLAERLRRRVELSSRARTISADLVLKLSTKKKIKSQLKFDLIL